jgi:hypothetical protein
MRDIFGRENRACDALLQNIQLPRRNHLPQMYIALRL